MKIRELLEGPVNPKFGERTVNKRLGGYVNKRANFNKATGGFSNVVPDADPHMVKKSSNTPMEPGETEGFRAFIEYIVKNGLTDNPHFPKVYSVKKIVGRDGKYIDSYKTEKLLTRNDVDFEEFRDFVQTTIKPEHLTWKFSNAKNNREMMDYLADNIRHECFEKSNIFTLDSLNEACAIIDEMVESLNGANDLHGGNVLLRRTPFGLQVVLNDPLVL